MLVKSPQHNVLDGPKREARDERGEHVMRTVSWRRDKNVEAQQDNQKQRQEKKSEKHD